MSRVSVNTLPFSTRLHPKCGHAKDILARDRARAQKLMSGKQPHGPLVIQEMCKRDGSARALSGQSDSGNSIDVTDAAVTYTAMVKMGQSGQSFKLLIDTGSSNTWVGADQEYKPSPSSKNTRKAVNVSYGSGSFTGMEMIDRCELSPGLVIDSRFPRRRRIGPVDLTQGTVSGLGNIPTVTDNLKSEGKIPKESIAISYQPTAGANMANGEMTFGSEDSAKYTGDITYVPITSTSPACKYWGIDQSVTYGKNTVIMSKTAGIVDTGTTLLLMSSGAYKKYMEATGAKMDESTGLLCVTKEQFGKMENLCFKIGSTTFEMTPNAQIWPRSMNAMMGGKADGIYLVVADMGDMGGSGLEFIDGFAFLQRFYCVYDTTNSRVGLANTPHTQDNTN
ncbi:acid protease [Desarmillaria tabescens]|uniref:Acid protease n=1 Tax=Armillaria tabescens TaxID=1929756 RepID=A0AA39TX69_ARMTA|nr:acid protease [Desarmillaria tabescens]KAK0462105.1 acid protease [Desarmillaria tabescens]